MLGSIILHKYIINNIINIHLLINDMAFKERLLCSTYWFKKLKTFPPGAVCTKYVFWFTLFNAISPTIREESCEILH